MAIQIKHYHVKNILIKLTYLNYIINSLKKSDKWEIQLTIANNFISSIDTDEERVVHSESDNIEIIMNDDSDKL